MKNVFKVIAIIAIIAGAVIGKFSTIPLADYIAIGLKAFGFTSLIVLIVKKAEKKTWKEFTGIACIIVCGICCVIERLSEGVISQLASLFVVIITFISGLFIVKQKKTNA